MRFSIINRRGPSGRPVVCDASLGQHAPEAILAEVLDRPVDLDPRLAPIGPDPVVDLDGAPVPAGSRLTDLPLRGWGDERQPHPSRPAVDAVRWTGDVGRPAGRPGPSGPWGGGVRGGGPGGGRSGGGGGEATAGCPDPYPGVASVPPVRSGARRPAPAPTRDGFLGGWAGAPAVGGGLALVFSWGGGPGAGRAWVNFWRESGLHRCSCRDGVWRWVHGPWQRAVTMPGPACCCGPPPRTANCWHPAAPGGPAAARPRARVPGRRGRAGPDPGGVDARVAGPGPGGAPMTRGVGLCTLAGGAVFAVVRPDPIRLVGFATVRWPASPNMRAHRRVLATARRRLGLSRWCEVAVVSVDGAAAISPALLASAGLVQSRSSRRSPIGPQ